MLKIVFCPNGHHVADNHALEYVDSVFYEYDFGGRRDMTVKVGNELIIDGFVLRVLEKKFPANEIEIYDNNIKLKIDDCYGLVAEDDRQLTLGAHARITTQILKLGVANIRAKGLSKKDSERSAE